jgi:PAS domain S-box-containing protein
MFNVLLCISSEHDLWLVLVAALVCVPSTFATFFLYSKVPPFPLWRRWAWLGMTGTVAGCGIWTTHFVAMQAFKTGLATGYDVLPTLGSLLVAVLSTVAGFAIASPKVGAAKPANALVGGLVVGLGITAMHYVGMAGYRTTGLVQWDLRYVAASVLVGAVFAAAAIAVAGRGAHGRNQALAAGLLSLGIVGMHFTGMTAVTIIPVGGMFVPASLMSNAVMVTASVAVTFLIILVATGGVVFDSASRNGHLTRLREALDVLPEGLAFFDGSDRLIAWNTQYADICRIGGVHLDVGMAFAEILKSSVVHGAYPDAAGRETEWIADRTAARWDSRTVTQRTTAGRWLRITERRTADGGTVSVSVDVTDLKNAEAAMAAARDSAEELSRRAEAAEAVAGLGHWRLDAATRQITWSDQMYRIYGFALDQVLDLDAVMAMTHPDDMAFAIARLERQLAEGGADENSVTRIISADGDIRYLVGSSDVQRGEGGEILSVIGTATDVTAQKLAEIALRTSEERFRRLAVNAPDMITEFRLDGTMTYVSPASLMITGFAPEELIGRPFMSLMEPEDGEKVLAMCQTVFRSKGKIAPWSVEFRARHKEGAELWLECRPTLAVDPATGKFTCLNDVVRDITARKAMEAQLREAEARAQAAATVKADFLANMSHELRTPLTSIIGFVGLATEQTDLSPLTRDYVGRVSNASRALLCTVNDILDFSKLEAGQVSIQKAPVALAEVTRATLDLFTPQAGAKDLVLTLDDEGAGDDLVLQIDPDRVRQILLNLVSNAVKFTEAGGVTLKTRYDRSAERLRVEVIDTGAGLTAEQQGRLFKRFSQIDGSLTRTQSGTGLGLAICKGLAEAMGGEIGVESRLGEGSRFWFEIPAVTAVLPMAPSGAARRDEISFPGVRVLVADDNAANRELVRVFLAGVGAEVSEARDGEEAARMATEMPYDVILMDIQMPVLNGPGALRLIRAERGPNDVTPILAFTAGATADTRAQLLDLGFESIVEKPIDARALIIAVAQATAFAEQLQEAVHVA